MIVDRVWNKRQCESFKCLTKTNLITSDGRTCLVCVKMSSTVIVYYCISICLSLPYQ